jgi:hypothetical protein
MRDGKPVFRIAHKQSDEEAAARVVEMVTSGFFLDNGCSSTIP